MDKARKQIADLIGASAREIIFTSGATESDNLAIKGVAEMYAEKGNHIITAATEHKAVLDTCKRLEKDGVRVTYLAVQQNGLVDLDQLREAITDKIIPVGYLPAYNLVPPDTANFPGGNALDFKSLPYPQRYAQAQALMREAGFGPGNRLKATYLMRSTAAGYQRSVSAAVQQMFALIYLDISIIPTDAQVFYKQIQEHDFEIAVPGWQADFDDASNFLDIFRTNSGNNWGVYSNPVFDRALDAASEETSLEARGEKLKAAEAILLKDQAFIPLFFWVNGNLVRPYVKGFKANAMDVHKSRWISIDERARAALFTS